MGWVSIQFHEDLVKVVQAPKTANYFDRVFFSHGDEGEFLVGIIEVIG